MVLLLLSSSEFAAASQQGREAEQELVHTTVAELLISGLNFIE